jgi:hypothetical protein
MIVLIFIFISHCTYFLSDANSSFAERMELGIFFFWNGMDGGCSQMTNVATHVKMCKRHIAKRVGL